MPAAVAKNTVPVGTRQGATFTGMGFYTTLAAVIKFYLSRNQVLGARGVIKMDLYHSYTTYQYHFFCYQDGPNTGMIPVNVPP